MKHSSNKERNVSHYEKKKQNVIKEEIKYTYFTNENVYKKNKKIISRDYIII